jgi:hypothetical protein
MFTHSPAGPGRLALFGPSPRRHPVQRRLKYIVKATSFHSQVFAYQQCNGMLLVVVGRVATLVVEPQRCNRCCHFSDLPMPCVSLRVLAAFQPPVSSLTRGTGEPPVPPRSECLRTPAKRPMWSRLRRAMSLRKESALHNQEGAHLVRTVRTVFDAHLKNASRRNGSPSRRPPHSGPLSPTDILRAGSAGRRCARSCPRCRSAG